MCSAARGHRALPHTADVILEAWGPGLVPCLEEAVAALVETYAADVRGPAVAERTVHLEHGPEEALILGTLEEVIFTLDTSELVPVGGHAALGEGGALEVALALAERRTVEPTGAVPKAVSRSGLRVTSRPGRVRCRFLVDL